MFVEKPLLSTVETVHGVLNDEQLLTNRLYHTIHTDTLLATIQHSDDQIKVLSHLEPLRYKETQAQYDTVIKSPVTGERYVFKHHAHARRHVRHISFNTQHSASANANGPLHFSSAQDSEIPYVTQSCNEIENKDDDSSENDRVLPNASNRLVN